MYTSDEFRDVVREKIERRVTYSYSEDNWSDALCIVFASTSDLEGKIYYTINETINAIYVHLPIGYGIWTNPAPLQKEKVEKIQDEILKSIEEHKEWNLNTPENKLKRNLKAFFARQYNNILEEYRKAEENVENLRSNYVNARKRRDEYEIIYKSFNMESKIKRLTEHISDIKDNEFVNNVSFIDNIIRVETKELPCYEEEMDRYYLIPEAIINIDINKGDVEFYPLKNEEGRKGWWNQTYNEENSMQVHPHISYNGKACLGNATEQLADAFDKKEYCSVFLICLAFLQNVNIHDVAGQGVCRWDECDSDCNVIKAGHDPEEDEYGDYLDSYSIEDMLETYGSARYKECHVCGERHPVDEMYYCEICDRYVCREHWNFDHEMCEECYGDNYVHDLITGEEIDIGAEDYFYDTDSNGITVYFTDDNEDGYKEYLKNNNPEKYGLFYGDEDED